MFFVNEYSCNQKATGTGKLQAENIYCGSTGSTQCMNGKCIHTQT
jgi:hypothetical protein